MVVFNSQADESKPPLNWGMNDDRVVFWPYWRNGDVVTVAGAPDVKVSAWTLPARGEPSRTARGEPSRTARSEPGRADRVLFCVFNYSKAAAADASVTLDLRKLGVALSAGAVAADAEKKGTDIAGEFGKGQARIRATIGPRDYRLIAVGPVLAPGPAAR
jgi:hypothetical protein